MNSTAFHISLCDIPASIGIHKIIKEDKRLSICNDVYTKLQDKIPDFKNDVKIFVKNKTK